jgi:hypothetical protein
MAKSKMRILGKPKPPQTGEFSSKVAEEPVAEPNASIARPLMTRAIKKKQKSV